MCPAFFSKKSTKVSRTWLTVVNCEPIACAARSGGWVSGRQRLDRSFAASLTACVPRTLATGLVGVGLYARRRSLCSSWARHLKALHQKVDRVLRLPRDQLLDERVKLLVDIVLREIGLDTGQQLRAGLGCGHRRNRLRARLLEVGRLPTHAHRVSHTGACQANQGSCCSAPSLRRDYRGVC